MCQKVDEFSISDRDDVETFQLRKLTITSILTDVLKQFSRKEETRSLVMTQRGGLTHSNSFCRQLSVPNYKSQPIIT